MAGKLYREDLMIWKAPDEDRWYIIEREPFEKEGIKKGVFCYGTAGKVAQFASLAAAEAELARWPSRAGEGGEAGTGGPAGEGAGQEAAAPAGT